MALTKDRIINPACFTTAELEDLRRLALRGLEVEKRTLKPETVETVRSVCRYERDMRKSGREGPGKITDLSSALADLSRAYPEEE